MTATKITNKIEIIQSTHVCSTYSNAKIKHS